jgi:hypothetical protein
LGQATDSTPTLQSIGGHQVSAETGRTDSLGDGCLPGEDMVGFGAVAVSPPAGGVTVGRVDQQDAALQRGEAAPRLIAVVSRRRPSVGDRDVCDAARRSPPRAAGEFLASTASRAAANLPTVPQQQPGAKVSDRQAVTIA